MDENLAKLSRIYPDSKFVKIEAYNVDYWKDKVYDSSHDNKATSTNWKTGGANYEQAQKWVDMGYRVGWIVPRGYVVIDVDNVGDARAQEYIEKILQKFEVKYSYNYTNHGAHFLFQDIQGKIKTGARMKCALNMVVDTRANASGYIILPCNDPHREWGKWYDYVEEVPYFLKPLFKDETTSFIGLVEGDGRNDALYSWRKKLVGCKKLNDAEIEKSIRTINEYLFDQPIPNSELFKTVLREQKELVKDEKLEKENIYNQIAEDMTSRYDIISYSDDFYSFNGTYYKRLTNIEVEKLIHFGVSKNIASNGRKEIMNFLKVKTQVPLEQFNKDWHKIAVKNGILNLVTGELEMPNKSDINTICIPYNYDKDPVYSPRIDQFMKEVTGGDAIKMQFLYQIVGYSLLKQNVFQKFVIMKGEGGTGKSTFTNLMQKLIGGEHTSHVSLANFDDEYYIALLHNKLLNIDDDVVDGKVLNDTGKFKSIVAGEKIATRPIYRDILEFVPFVFCIFSCNRLPRIMDKTTGLYRRMLLIELNNKVENPDPLFINKITDQDMEYFLFKAVEGIVLALEEGKFRITQSERALLETFKRRQSPLNEWLYENNMTTGDFHNKKCLPFYSEFKSWCEQNGYMKIMSNYTFKDDICRLYDMEVTMIKNEAGTPMQVFYKRGDFNPTFRPF